MQNDQGNSGNMNASGEKFVDRVEKAITQLVILNKAQQGEVTKQNLQQTFRQGSFAQGGYGKHFDTCIQTLVSEGHLKQQGDKLTITDDGREDIQKLQSVVLELPQLVGGNVGGQQKQGVTAQRTTSGTTTGNVGSGGNVGGSTGSNQGNVGTGGNTNNPNRNR